MILPGFLLFSARSERYGAVRQMAKYRSERALNHKLTESQNLVSPGFLLKIRPGFRPDFYKNEPE